MQIISLFCARSSAPDEADRLTDFVSTTMAGLSAKVRNGAGLDQLLSTARLAGAAVAGVLLA